MKSTHSRHQPNRKKDLSCSITQESASTAATPAQRQYKTLKAQTALSEKRVPSQTWTTNDMQVLFQARAGLRPGHAGVMLYAEIVPLLSTPRSELACRLKIWDARARKPGFYNRFREIVDFYHPYLKELDRQRKPDTLEKKPRKARKSRAKKAARASTQSQGGIAGAVNTAQQEDSKEEPMVSEEELAESEETPDSSQPAQQHKEEAENEEDEVDHAETEDSALPSYLTILEECLQKCRLTEKTPPSSGSIPGLGDFLKARLAGKDVAFFDSVEAHCRRYHAVEKTRALTAREKTRVWELRQAAEQLKFSYYIS